MRRRKRASRVGVLLAFTLAATGCRTDGLAFAQRESFRITAPTATSAVAPPVQVAWTQFETDESASPRYYAVLIDREPPKPGQSLRALTNKDCRRNPGCPDAAFLKGLNIYVTDALSITVDTFPARDRAKGGRDVHEIVVIALDDAGKRASEYYASTEFELDRSVS